jgi:hypothetical protein
MGAPGCDDAPYVDVPLGVRSKRVNMIYPYYENPTFLKKQFDGWKRFVWKGVAEHLSVFVVDDGSPNAPAEPVLRNAMRGVRLFRVEVDIRWNWIAARNIGAHHASDDWLLLTDMDHVVEEEVLHNLIWGTHDPFTIYRFSRRESNGKHIHPHPNSWFMTKRMFWRIGGYDEALSGHYGTDGEYRRRCAATAPVRILNDMLVRHEYEGDSSTTHYLRKQPQDAAVKRMIRARGSKWRPRTMTFPYHEVKL